MAAGVQGVVLAPVLRREAVEVLGALPRVLGEVPARAGRLPKELGAAVPLALLEEAGPVSPGSVDPLELRLARRRNLEGPEDSDHRRSILRRAARGNRAGGRACPAPLSWSYRGL